MTNFEKSFQKHNREIKKLLKQRKNLKKMLAKHNYGYLDFDFERYFNLSKFRYQKTLEILDFPQHQKILDVGGFFGIWALILKDFDNDVTIIEKYSHFGNYFNIIEKHLQNYGLKVIDQDLVLEKYKSQEKYDIITLMALLEHLSDSPKIIFENIKKLLGPKSSLIIEVPNLAYWPKRIRLLLGHSVLPEIRNIYHSKIPFTGHNHEYTLQELYNLAQETGFKITKIITYNYSLESSLEKIKNFPIYIFPNTREVILAKLEKNELQKTKH